MKNAMIPTANGIAAEIAIGISAATSFSDGVFILEKWSITRKLLRKYAMTPMPQRVCITIF